MLTIDMMIGGIAGVISRTLTAPLELNKIQKQNFFMKNTSLQNVIQKEGLRYLWKGNGTNIIRIFPQMSINYSVYKKVTYLIDQSKFKNKINNDLLNFSSGAFSGMVAMTVIYPFETIRTRLSLQTNKSHYSGILDVIKKTKFKHLYGGLRMTLFGYSSYNAMNFMFYERYKQFLLQNQFDKKTVGFWAGGISGLTAISITYPTDLIRRRLQIQDMNKNIPKYNGIIDTIKKINQKEGIRGFYRGLLASYLKVFPAISLQFFTIEVLNDFLNID